MQTDKTGDVTTAETIYPPAGSAEVEFALVISRVLDAVEKNPELLRSTVYELARVKLRSDASQLSPNDSSRMVAALETAIQGVEDFSQRQQHLRPLDMLSISAPMPIATTGRDLEISKLQIYQTLAAHTYQASQIAGLIPADPKPLRVVPPGLRTPLRFIAGAVAIACAIGLLISHQRGSLSLTTDSSEPVRQPAPVASAAVTSTPPTSFADRAAEVAALPASTPAAVPQALPSLFAGLPLPSSYGIYVANNGTLTELEALQGQIPDKRVAISATITTPSKTVVASGRPEFLLFRRDLASSAPERIELRIVAKVKRAMTFDPSGKAGRTAVTDTWNIRNISFDLRVAPVPGNSEMLAVRPLSDDADLPPGRYALILKRQAYDFTVAGKITDSRQCLEKIDANNGAFYTECKMP